VPPAGLEIEYSDILCCEHAVTLSAPCDRNADFAISWSVLAMTSTPPSIKVTEATADDIPAIGVFFWAMWRQAGPEAPGFSGATDSVIAEIAQPEAIQSRIGGPDRRMYLAYVGETVVGFAATRVTDETTVELSGIVVLQTMVGRGIGSPLLTAAVTDARQRAFGHMTVSTEIDNERARGFYQARGFAVVGESTTNVEGTTVTVVDMKLDL
jgi:ribosomal protein S18 acetylase RimI-like enzyme